MVGSFYKLVPKVLSNRLKLVMNLVIGPTQMAFVKDLQILDSLVIADEVIHSWKKGGNGGLLVKLDFKKAYDSVSHGFLIKVLYRMGFGFRWQDWIKGCISSPSKSVLVNVSPMKQFLIQRGLRQGDHLSPFLFNMVVEVLSSMFFKEKDLNLIRVLDFGNGIIHISHLQFIDDTILFLEPKMEFLLNTKRILTCFELISGLKINFHKSCLVRVWKRGPGEED